MSLASDGGSSEQCNRDYILLQYLLYRICIMTVDSVQII